MKKAPKQPKMLSPKPIQSLFKRKTKDTNAGGSKEKQPEPADQKAISGAEQQFIDTGAPKEQLISSNLAENEQILRDLFKNCSDVVFRPLHEQGQIKFLLIYIDGLSDIRVLDEVVLKPILFEGIPQGLGELDTIGSIIQQQQVAVAQTSMVSTIGEVVNGILKANIAMLADGEAKALLADMKAWAARGVQEPVSEVVIRGPREGFTETLRTNTSMIRRKLKTTKLKMESLIVGDLSQTDIVLIYMEGIVNQAILEEVKTRVKRIQIDAVLESHYIEEFIEDSPFSPFPQVRNTERPDAVAAAILEGKIAIIVDGTPFALVVPMTFWGGIQTPEDYYERFIYTTAVRWIRIILLNLSIFLTPAYVAATTFHPQMLPANLVLSFAAAREPSPFPTVIEAFIMEFMFEGLREAGIRLPIPAGSAVSIVGALVIGQAAVQAGIVTAPMVIVVAASGIASFAIPRYNFGFSFRLLRFPMLLLAGAFGVFGLTFGFLAMLIHTINLRSFGVPYMSPVAPQIGRNLKDILIRSPRWSLRKRPELMAETESERVPPGQKPGYKR